MARIGIVYSLRGENRQLGLMRHIAMTWARDGHEVSMVFQPPTDPGSYDLLVNHVDLTVTPEPYARVFREHPRTLNGRLLDISKRVISRNAVSPGSSWNGPVIVKTNRNFGGMPEREVEDALRARRGEDPWPHDDVATLRSLPPDRYPIFRSWRDVPQEVWGNPFLFVERFLPERDGELYCHRICFVLGDVVLSHRVYGNGPIIKGKNLIRAEEVDPPPGLDAIREELGIDYGKLDLVVHGDETHLLDANRTPGGVEQEINAKVAELLAPGLARFLD